MDEIRLTGGCQCGAVRYAITALPDSVSICHCRMCQKATGGAFLVTGTVPAQALTWTRGQPASFQSSSVAARDFCAHCGTPLSFRFTPGTRISVTLGSLDQPSHVQPTEQIGIEARMTWWERMGALPQTATNMPDGIGAPVSHQHPDHDTAEWTPLA